MRRQLLLLLVAIQFLTRLPVPAGRDLPADALAESARFFPLVGAIVGVGAIGIDLLVGSRAGRHVSVVLILLYFVAVTGGLHEDGLADAADGFGGGWTKDRVLAIMRDSNIGSFGALALGFSLLARFVFLTGMSAASFHGVLLAGQVLNRWATLPLMHWLPSARSDDGQGARVARKTSTTSLVIGTVFAVIIASAACGVTALLMIAVAGGVAALTGAYYRRRIGGITGDCLGATCQLTEAAVYLAGVVS
ncbi:MAG TPA: adenosylcobinamide-GDP ribazoletransferase [Vicinamibacterales bacterium]|nr:adenosylcobinamide-GDP ribazoletransferase [Vicinamibacterales bacterium]